MSNAPDFHFADQPNSSLAQSSLGQSGQNHTFIPVDVKAVFGEAGICAKRKNKGGMGIKMGLARKVSAD